MALRLSKLFGNSPEFWLNAQRALDLRKAEKQFSDEIDHIQLLQLSKREGKSLIFLTPLFFIFKIWIKD